MFDRSGLLALSASCRYAVSLGEWSGDWPWGCFAPADGRGPSACREACDRSVGCALWEYNASAGCRVARPCREAEQASQGGVAVEGHLVQHGAVVVRRSLTAEPRRGAVLGGFGGASISSRAERGQGDRALQEALLRRRRLQSLAVRRRQLLVAAAAAGRGQRVRLPGRRAGAGRRAAAPDLPAQRPPRLAAPRGLGGVPRRVHVRLRGGQGAGRDPRAGGEALAAGPARPDALVL
mmetsp:Transcript_13347/g.42213  ORF Transcript_13347/g.42213 Transcript_13347/m.42213 type:complete len:236 (-) Transcript_13347:106-813(-)